MRGKSWVLKRYRFITSCFTQRGASRASVTCDWEENYGVVTLA
jgi:hypothetical protein